MGSSGSASSADPSPFPSLLSTQASTPQSYKSTLIGRLPVELLTPVFCHCDPNIKARLPLIHTCRHWRVIASNTASLWTKVNIHLHNPSYRDKFMSLLDLQLSRAGSLLLDVRWHGYLPDYYDLRVRLFLQGKAPFSRWRSLTVGVIGDAPEGHPAPLFGPHDSLSNLKTLFIERYTSKDVIMAINHMTTPALQNTDFYAYEFATDLFEIDYAQLLRYTSKLNLPCYVHSDSRKQFLPPSITDFRASGRKEHVFPHLLTYRHDICKFDTNRIPDLRSLTTLTVSFILHLTPNCELLLPRLRHLTYHMIKLGEMAKFEAPMLETLTIARNNNGKSQIKETFVTAARVAFTHPGYLLSPRESLAVELYFPEDVILTQLEKSPLVERVSLCIGYRTCAEQVMGKLFTRASGLQAEADAGESMCSHLVELTLNFGWRIDDVDFWRRLALSAVKGRKISSSGSTLAIYAEWEGEGTRVLLTKNRVVSWIVL